MTHDASDPLAPLRARFRERARQDARGLEAALAGEPADFAAIESIAHGLAGMAGMFGHAGLAAAALALDGEFAAGRTPSTEAVRALIATIDRAVDDSYS